MSNYDDDRFSAQRDEGLQAQAEWERTPTRVCGWHHLHFPDEAPLMERGGNGKVTTAMCAACAKIENAKADRLLAQIKQRAEGCI